MHPELAQFYRGLKQIRYTNVRRRVTYSMRCDLY